MESWKCSKDSKVIIHSFIKSRESGKSEFLAFLDCRNTLPDNVGTSSTQRFHDHICRTLLPISLENYWSLTTPQKRIDKQTKSSVGTIPTIAMSSSRSLLQLGKRWSCVCTGERLESRCLCWVSWPLELLCESRRKHVWTNINRRQLRRNTNGESIRWWHTAHNARHQWYTNTDSIAN